MNTTAATYATHIHQWLRSQPARHEPCIHVKTLGLGKKFSFCWSACFRCVVKAS